MVAPEWISKVTWPVVGLALAAVGALVGVGAIAVVAAEHGYPDALDKLAWLIAFGAGALAAYWKGVGTTPRAYRDKIVEYDAQGTPRTVSPPPMPAPRPPSIVDSEETKP